MALLIFALAFIAITSAEIPTKDLEHILIYPVEATKKAQKRAATNAYNATMKDSKVREFIENTLIEHGQILEHLVKTAERNERLINQLLKSLSTMLEQPKVPEKVEVGNIKNRRTLDSDEKVIENPVIRFGKSIQKNGELFKNLINRYVQDNADPIPYVEN